MKASTLYYIALLLLGVKMFSQSNPSIKTDLPQIAPPSPTVAALMKFEEVPVNNYTGIPDISIPLYGVQSHSKDIGINLSLKYHPGSIAVDEEAGYTGLGWSLTGGGTISRTVRGVPDDAVDNFNKRFGIHMYDIGTNSNPYYEVMSLDGIAVTPDQEYTRSKYYWEAFEKGKYDTQHDLYQFNFMGHQGRFYIKRVTDSNYEIVRLDNDNAIKINYDGSTKIFTVYDDKGYKYIFDIKEETTENSFVLNTYFDNMSSSSATAGQVFISAFHLSKIYDTNGKLLVEFKYNTPSEIITESTSDVSTTRSFFLSPSQSSALTQLTTGSSCPGNVQKIEPMESNQYSSRSTKTKKIKQIRIFDKALINFTLTNGSSDPNGPQIYRLKHITVHPWNDSTAVVKRFELFYDYSEVNYGVDPKQRLMLTKVSEKETSGPKTQSHELFYTQPYNGSYGKDYWGYFNHIPANVNHVTDRTATPGACKVDALEKMRLPSGGAIVFNFESNTYSFIGSTEVTDYSGNPENSTFVSSTYPGYHMVSPGVYNSYFNSTSSYTDSYTFTASQNMRYVSFKGNIVSGNPGTFEVYEIDPVEGEIEILSFSCSSGSGPINCVQTAEVPFYPNKVYKVKYKVFIMSGVGQAQVIGYERSERNPQLQFHYGGGIRIKNIGYFADGDVPQNFYTFPDESYAPSKQKNYNYNLFTDSNKSSGSLVFPKPVYEYSHRKQYYMRCVPPGGLPRSDEFTFNFRTVTTFNNLKISKTQGSDVGYKNVTVSETGNGYSKYEYISPIDKPEENYTMTFPFLPNINYDHRRGHLINEKHYKEGGQLLSETLYNYDVVEGTHEKTGVFLSANNNCKYAHLYENYNSYAGAFPYTCNNINYIGILPLMEAFGWVKLTQKTTKEYFYTSTNSAQGTVETKETYTYNSLNKKIASVTTETYTGGSTPETVSQEFSYLYDAALLPTNKISEIERVVSKKDGAITGAQKIVYVNTYPGNTAWLPGTIQAAKESSVSMENRVQFVKYDTWSNPLEVKLENGTPVSYIWGYNKTQPIAMIENATYEQLATALGTSVENIRDNYGEANLAAINGLRTSMVTAMVTTYTYTPLVGVSTVTDPKGAVTTYEYDLMGRLKAVKDRDGNLLSENEYHYRMP